MPTFRDHQQERHGRRDDVLHFQPGLLQEITEGAQRKKTQVRSIEDSAIRIVEATKKEIQPHPKVGNVRHRHDDLAVRAQITIERLEYLQGIPQMFQNIAVNDDVERLVQYRERLVQISDNHFVAMVFAQGG